MAAANDVLVINGSYWEVAGVIWNGSTEENDCLSENATRL